MAFSRSPLRSLLAGGARNGFASGYRMAARGYHTYRPIVTPVWDRPATIDDGLRIVDQEYRALKKAGAFGRDGTLKLLLSPEGKLNGRSGSGGGKSGAQWPVEAKVERAMIARWHELLKAEPPGSIYAMVNYVDCDEVGEDGRQIGETRGALIESGTEGMLTMFGKKNADPVDGWDYSRWSYRPGKGPEYYLAKDTAGDGRDVLMRLFICADVKELPAIDPFPPEMLLVGLGSGIPKIDPVSESTHFVLVDQVQRESSDPLDDIPANLIGLRKTAYPVEGWPSLTWIESAGMTGTANALKSGLTYFCGVPPSSFTERRIKVAIERARPLLAEGVKLLDLGPRTLPDASDEAIDRMVRAVDGGDSVATKPVGEPVQPDARSPEQQVLDELADALERSPNPEWPTEADPQKPTEDPYDPNEPDDPDDPYDPEIDK